MKTNTPIKIPENYNFGDVFTDHMIEMDYEEGEWGAIVIKPYGPITIEPSNCALHYGQSVFEGQKAYKVGDNINIFRPKDNLARLNKSQERMCIPKFTDEDLDKIFNGLLMLLRLDRNWVPEEPSALYIRHFTFATENFVGLRPSKTYKTMIILTPVPPYLNGFAPTKLWVPDHYTRASIGGVGEAKTSGNYAPTLMPVEEAHDKGYSNCLFLRDGGIITECAAANIFFVIRNKIITPKLDGTILHGITRDSVIKLAKLNSMDVEEKIITINDLMFEAYHGKLQEIFMCGTAACVIPVSELLYGDKIIKPIYDIGIKTKFMYEELTDIQYSRTEDTFGWVYKIL